MPNYSNSRSWANSRRGITELPHSIEAEQSVLGGLLLDNTKWADVEHLSGDDFHFGNHRAIFQAIKGLAEKDIPFDVITLSDSGRLNDVADLAYLATLAKDTPSASNVRFYAGIVFDHARRRDVIQTCLELVEAARDHSSSVDCLTGSATSKFSALSRNSMDKRNQTISATELCAKHFSQTKWVVPGIIPAGVTLLVGAPKVGKSWLALDIGIAVSVGGYVLGKTQVDPGTVLYLALEDNERRLKSRLVKLLNGKEPPPSMHFKTVCPRIGNGAVEELRKFLKDQDDCRLIIIDTLARVRPDSKNNELLYASDYAVGAALLPLAAEFDIGIVLVHHTRKATSDDHLETVSGSTGLTGGVDNVIIMKRVRGTNEAMLYVDGRDIERAGEYGLKWDELLAKWTISEEGSITGLSPERKAVFDVIKEYGPINGKDITKLLHPNIVIGRSSKEWTATRRITSKLVDSKLVVSTAEGFSIV